MEGKEGFRRDGQRDRRKPTLLSQGSVVEKQNGCAEARLATGSVRKILSSFLCYCFLENHICQTRLEFFILLR